MVALQAKNGMNLCTIVMPLAHQRGGAEALLLHVLRENAASPRVEFSIIFFEDGPMVEDVKALGYRVSIIKAGRLSELHHYARTVWKLRRELRQQRIGSVLSWMAKAQLYSGLAGWGLNVPNYWFQHGISEGGWMDRLASALPTTGIFACSDTAAWAQRKSSPGRAVLTCYPAVDLDHIDSVRKVGQAYWRSRLNLPAKTPIVGMVARMERWKGVNVFIEVIKRLGRLHPNLHAFVVGGAHSLDPDYAQELYTQAAETGLGERLRLVGQRPLEEVAGWWCACDFAIHQVTGVEPFGMVVVEAMALGRPVIASALGGPAEIIQDGVNGLLCKPGDLGGFTRLAESLLADSDLRQSLGRAARVRARDFSAQAILGCLASHLSGESWEATQ
jgi:glycosyltransferase involved in cell wall biosynthesis